MRTFLGRAKAQRVALVTGALIAALLLLLMGARLYGAHRWDSETRELRTRLNAAREPVRPRSIDFRELEGLPAPVARYFRTVLEDGQPMVSGARVRHEGTFDMGEGSEDDWKPFTSDQVVVTRRPGFDWDGRVAVMPGLPVRVHDSYATGEGVLHASVLGLLTVADMRGTGEMAEGELMRFVAEAAWYPTALLPSQGVRWEAVDERSARATLRDGDVSVTLLFAFDEGGAHRDRERRGPRAGRGRRDSPHPLARALLGLRGAQRRAGASARRGCLAASRWRGALLAWAHNRHRP